jgi:hypothetical protein
MVLRFGQKRRWFMTLWRRENFKLLGINICESDPGPFSTSTFWVFHIQLTWFAVGLGRRFNVEAIS